MIWTQKLIGKLNTVMVLVVDTTSRRAVALVHLQRSQKWTEPIPGIALTSPNTSSFHTQRCTGNSGNIETSSKIPKWKTLFSCILPTVTKNWEFTGIEDLLWVRWLIAFPTKTSARQRHNCYNPFPLGPGEWPSCSLALSLKTQGLEMRNEIKVELYITF